MAEVKGIYWNEKGKHQEALETIQEVGIDNFDLPKVVKNKYKKAIKQYNRFYNDGDIPRGYASYPESFIVSVLEEKMNHSIKEVATLVGLDCEPKK